MTWTWSTYASIGSDVRASSRPVAVGRGISALLGHLSEHTEL